MLKKIRLALYDEEGYMPCLVDYLCKKGHQMLESRLFTNVQLLKESANNGEIDVLLAGEEVVEKIQGLDKVIPQIMLLSEGDKACEGSSYILLFKYQSAQEIVREILSQVAEDDRIQCGGQKSRRRNIEMIGVYSPFGGGGVTQYALTMIKELGKENQALYINLELFNGLDFMLPRGKEKNESYRGMSEVIFYLKQRKEKLALKLESVIFSADGIDGIAAVEDYRDLYNISQEEMAQFLDVLEGQTAYSKVVFDIGYLSEASLYLMSQCSRVYIPQPQSRIQQSKEDAFRRLLIRENYDELEKSIAKIEKVRGIDVIDERGRETKVSGNTRRNYSKN